MMAGRASRFLSAETGLRVSFEFFPPKTEAMEPSQDLLGLMEGASLWRPQARPM